MRVSSALPLVLASLAACAAANPFWGQAPLSTSAPPDTVHTSASWGWEDCGSPDDIAHLRSISVSPDPPEPGKDLTLTVDGYTTETIEDGAYADVTVKLGLIKLLTKTFDVCDEARKANVSVQCPIEQGSYKVTHTVALPKEIPRAKFNVAVAGYTVNDDPLVCLKLTVDFFKRPF